MMDDTEQTVWAGIGWLTIDSDPNLICDRCGGTEWEHPCDEPERYPMIMRIVAGTGREMIFCHACGAMRTLDEVRVDGGQGHGSGESA